MLLDLIIMPLGPAFICSQSRVTGGTARLYIPSNDSRGGEENPLSKSGLKLISYNIIRFHFSHLSSYLLMVFLPLYRLR